MSNDREILLGELKEFKNSTTRRLDTIETKIDALSAFKWKVTGIMAFIVFAFESVLAYLRMKND